MAKLQCVIVGVRRMETVRSGDWGLRGKVDAMCMSARFTTAREPRERGCSGSEIVDMRSTTVNNS